PYSPLLAYPTLFRSCGTCSMNEARPLRILIIKTHAIGDLLMTTPAIRDIRGAHPQAHITLLVGKWSSPAIRWNPHIDERIEVERSEEHTSELQSREN